METETRGGIGHNSQSATINVEARLFNSMNAFAPLDGPFPRLTLPAGATVGDVIRELKLPIQRICLVLKNGRDVTRGLLSDPINTDAVLDDGDVIAFSGPVPYSYGYGAPVV